MKTVGLDTSVVLRLLTGEPGDHAGLARKYVESCYYAGAQVCISDMVVGEAYHALIYHYNVPKGEAVKALEQLLSSSMITATGHAIAVLSGYQGKGVGLIDQLIRMDFLEHAHEIVTFDKDFARMQNVRLLK